MKKGPPGTVLPEPQDYSAAHRPRFLRAGVREGTGSPVPTAPYRPAVPGSAPGALRKSTGSGRQGP